MPNNRPSLLSIVEAPLSFEPLHDNPQEALLEARRIGEQLQMDRYSVFAVSQIMRYASEFLTKEAVNLLVAKLADPEHNKHLCYDAPLVPYRDPKAARLWALLEIIPPVFLQQISDKTIEFWLRHPNSEIQEIGVEIARANRRVAKIASLASPKVSAVILELNIPFAPLSTPNPALPEEA